MFIIRPVDLWKSKKARFVIIDIKEAYACQYLVN